jgi:hypothetical protein
MDARVGATSQPQGIVLAIKVGFDDTDVSSDVHNEKIREEKGESYIGILQVWSLCERPRFVSLVLLASNRTTGAIVFPSRRLEWQIFENCY